MEGFFEANEVVEMSLSKLGNIKRTGDLPLRKTLMVSRVLSRAQEVASSAQDSLLLLNSSRCSSKLLASFANNEGNVDEDGLASNHPTAKFHSRELSPIATESHELESVALQLPDQEPMDLENVNSFLDTILQDIDSKTELLPHNQYLTPLQELHMEDNRDVGALCSDTSSDVCARLDTMLAFNRPVSPGKRNYQQAFPFITAEHSQPSQENLDLKRFKACMEVASPLDSLPGFCGYLSTKNLQTAPFITYMFGKGFTRPSNLDSDLNDWPAVDSSLPSSSNTVSAILAF